MDTKLLLKDKFSVVSSSSLGHLKSHDDNLRQSRERGVNLSYGTGVQNMDLQSESSTMTMLSARRVPLELIDHFIAAGLAVTSIERVGLADITRVKITEFCTRCCLCAPNGRGLVDPRPSG